MRAVVAVLALLALAPVAPLAPAAFLAPVGEVLDAPAGAVSRGAEPSILVLPSGRILVGDTAGVHASDDGGASWRTIRIGWPPGVLGDGVALARDDEGTVYAADTNGQVVSVAASADEGRSWRVTTPIVEAYAVADRPWIAANGAGKVVVVYYAPGLGERCAFSTDGGATFLTRTLANSGLSNAGSVVLDDAGRVWYAQAMNVVRWPQPCAGTPAFVPSIRGGSQIFDPLALTDAGESFVPRPTAGNGQMVLRGMIGIDPATAKSVVVSPPTLRSNTFGAVAARPDGSEVAIAWYASTTGGNPASTSFPGEWHVYVARVTRFWTDAPDVRVTRVTTEPNHVGGLCMQGVTCNSDRDLLDYFGVAYGPDGAVHVAYGHDGATRNAEVRYARVG